MPKNISRENVISLRARGLMPPYGSDFFYESQELAQLVKELNEAHSLFQKIDKAIHELT